MERKLNIIFWGTFSLIILIIIANISYEDIGSITQAQQIDITENSEISSSKYTQFAQITQFNHDTITIDGNDEFSNHALIEGWTGNGTSSNPYLISNYSISATGESGINISNTNVYFRIVNVTITGSTNYETGAFYLSNVTNGELVNNTAISSEYGFNLFDSSYNTLTGNYASKCNYSFSSFHSSHNLLTKNTATNSTNGFYLYYSSFNNLTDNVASSNSFGFHLFKNNNENVLTNNIATDGVYGFSVVTSCKNILTNNNATNFDYGFYLFYHSNYNILMMNYASENNIGFEFANCRYTNITTNKAINNFENGFYFQDGCNLNDIIANTAENNDNYGFYAKDSSNNSFKNNIAKNNDKCGLSLFSASNNILINNSLYNNDFFIFGTKLVHFIQTEVSNNTINDLPIIYLKYSENLNYNNAQVGQIILVNSTDINISNNHFLGTLIIAFCDIINVQNNTVSHTNTGFAFYFMKDSTIINNSAVNNFVNGFYLSFSDNNIFKGNEVSTNGNHGFYITMCDSNTFNYNTITYNERYGIYIHHSEGNCFYLNIFIANNQGDTQAYSSCPNYWYYGIHGNYWSDYTGLDSNGDGIGDSAYSIDGGEGESDPYPLMSDNVDNITLVTDNLEIANLDDIISLLILTTAIILGMLIIVASLVLFSKRKITRSVNEHENNLQYEKLLEFPKQHSFSLSFNGEKLCFYSNKTGRKEIFCLDIITKEIKQITDGQLGKNPLSTIKWTRDNQNILFTKNTAKSNEKTNIFKMNLTTKKIIQLTDTFDSSNKLGNVDSSNTWIFFFSDRKSKITQLFRMKLDGTEVEQLTNHKKHVNKWSDLHFSPDCKKIAYTANEIDNPKNNDIWLYNLETDEDKNIISLKQGSNDSISNWSSDGSMITFESNFLGYQRVGIYFPDTADIKWYGESKDQRKEEYFGCLLPKHNKIIVQRYVNTNQTLIAYDITTGEEESLNLPSGFQTCIKQIIGESKIIVVHTDSIHGLRGLLHDYKKAKFDEIIPAEYGEFNPETLI